MICREYVSTRGSSQALPFLDSVCAGQPDDGGLFVPKLIPDLSDQLEQWRELNYEELCTGLMAQFIIDIPEAKLGDLITESYANFSHPNIAPFSSLGDRYVLELFHGPTLAFKDFGLQFLGPLFSYAMKNQGEQLNIVCATSGDTGSAAIASLRSKDNIRVFVMHPRTRPSRLQRLQMTTVLDDNVFNIAIDGSFDDCQSILKGMFAKTDFKSTHNLSTVNSINWGRILAQTVYYFYAYLKITTEPGEKVVFAVPTGNFGNLLSGYIAAKMGLPIAKLIVATNNNNILANFFNSGQYIRGDIHNTLSPAMDIQVASNLERYLYWHFEQDVAKVRGFMRRFNESGSAHFGNGAAFDPLIAAGAIDDQTTTETMRQIWQSHSYHLDPHTAVGVAAADKIITNDTSLSKYKLIYLATAHPAKFPQAVLGATGESEITHPKLQALIDLPERCVVLPASLTEVMNYISSSIQSS